MTLLSRLVKLAHSRPEIKPYLAPIVKEALWRRLPPASRSSYIPKDAVPVDPQGTDLEIYTFGGATSEDLYTTLPKGGKPGALAFAGKAQKPMWFHTFSSEAQRDKYIQDTIDARKEVIQRKIKLLEERRSYQHDYKIGDILEASWGYDQTNVNFYEVTQVIGKQIIVREIAQKVVSSEMTSDKVMPVPGKFISPPMRKTPGQGGYVRIDSVISAHKWDGKPQYQTNPMFGH